MYVLIVLPQSVLNSTMESVPMVGDILKRVVRIVHINVLNSEVASFTIMVCRLITIIG
jgi:hypothetical protein